MDEKLSNNFMNITIKKPRLYYFLLVLLAILFPLIHYPTIYGKDAFQVIWMANALQDGALFSENSWLIHPLSYFGYYPFSHRAIGVPIFLAFIMSVMNFISFGIFGISESILVLDIIIILIIYKSARNLGNTLFEEEWSRFIFVATILFSQIVLNAVTMTVSTRIIITIIMLNLLNLNLKLINNSIKKRKVIILMVLLFLIGALAHRLWIATIITIVFSIIMIFIRKSRNLKKISIFLILPVMVIAFFLGLQIISALDFNFLTRLDPNQTFAPYIDENSLLGISILLGWFYTWNTGLILIFLPIGFVIVFYKLAISVRDFKDRNNNIEKNQHLLQKYYLILFVIPFAFLLPTTFYSIVVFFPLIIIFSIYGLIYIKKFISKYSETLSWILLAILLSVSIVYSFLKVEVSVNINLWYVFLLTFLSFILFLVVFMINKFKILQSSKINFDPHKMKKGIWILILTFSIQIFSISTIETNRAGMHSSPYPWENIILTNEEIEIIEFFQNKEIDGLIFTTIGNIAGRIAAVGLLPTFYGRSFIGKAIWYDLITSNEVIENTEFIFSFSDLLRLRFFRYFPEYATYYYETSPLEVLRINIIALNMTIEIDRALLRSGFNVQYIISVKNSIDHIGNELVLIQSLYQSGIEPIFMTTNLLVWEIPI